MPERSADDGSLSAVPSTSVPPWRDHDFVHLWIAQATGLVGQQFSVLAVPLVAIITLGASASTVGLLVAVFNLPWLIFGLFVGVIVDRLPRRRLLIISDVARALLLLTVPLAALLGWLSIGQMFVLAILVGCFDVCWLTAYRSYVPNVVPSERLEQAYAATGATDGVTRTAVPSLAGLAIQWLGPPVGLIITGGSYLISAVSNATIRRREPIVAPGDHEPVLRAFVDGLLYTWRQRTVRSLAISDGLYFFAWAATQSLTLVFLNRNLGLSAGMIGVVYSVGTVGGLMSALLARRVGLRLGSGRSIVIGSLLRSLGMALLPVAIIAGPLALPVVIGSKFVNAYGWTLWDVHQETTKQRLLSDAVRGRANGSVQFVGGAALALGSAAGAGLAGLLSVELALTISGIATLLAVCWLAVTGIWSVRSAPTGS